MSSAMLSINRLPATWKAAKVMPSSVKIHFPVIAKSAMMPEATMQANPAIRTRDFTVSLGVIAMKAGTAAIGLTITNSELKARRK